MALTTEPHGSVVLQTIILMSVSEFTQNLILGGVCWILFGSALISTYLLIETIIFYGKRISTYVGQCFGGLATFLVGCLIDYQDFSTHN